MHEMSVNNADRPEDDVRDLVTPADNAEPAAERIETRERNADPVEKAETKEPKLGSPFDNHRTSAIEKYRAERDKATQTLPDDIERSRVGETVETRADRDAKREAATNPTEPETVIEHEPVAAPAKRKLKVQGRELELTDDEIIQKAQIALAADDVLGDAKRLKADLISKLELLDSAAKANQSRPVAEQDRSQPKPSEDTKPDDSELDDIIDRIQIGDKQEAKEALRKHGDLIQRRIVEQLGDIDARIIDTTRVHAENVSRQTRTREVLETFTSEYPEFGRSQPLQSALFTDTVNEMKTELLNLGVDPEVLALAQRQRGMSEADVIGTAYRDLQAKGYALPDHGDILRRSAENIRREFGVTPAPTPKPAPQPQSFDPAERIERKRVITPQPRRANISPGTEAAEMSREEKQRAAVQQMRAYRRGR
jgi:hypothetical protein